MKITEIIKDIFSDIEATDSRLEASNRDLGGRYDRNSGGGGFFVLLIPHLIGFALGLAIARLLEMNFNGYIAVGTLCAVMGGIYKSISFDKISLVPAIVRNLLIITPVFLYFAVIFVLGK